MSIREKITAIPPGVMGGGLVVVLLVLIFEGYSLLKSPGPVPVDMSKAGPMVFYTADEGVTLFAAADKQAAPVDSDGRPGVRAYVYSCGGKHFVQCLEKYSNGPGSPRLVEKPGTGNWVPASSPDAAAIRRPRCADGGTPVPVSAND